MNLASGWKIDWREQLGPIYALTEYGAGGVIHVHAREGAPTAAFTRVLRSTLSSDSRGAPWRTVQIDPNNSNTHYLADVVDQIRISTGATVMTSASPPASVQVGNNIRAGGNVTIDEVSISLPRTPTATLVESLCKSLRQRLLVGRVALIFVNTHKQSAENLDLMANVLWTNALDGLLEPGLLVVDIFDPVEMARQSSTWPPAPTIWFDLPSVFDTPARKAALEDVAALALANGLCENEEQADAFARAIISSHPDISSVHTGFTLAVARERQV